MSNDSSQKQNPIPSDGERAAITGFGKQYDLAACLILKSAERRLLSSIRIGDPQVGTFDDIVLREGEACGCDRRCADREGSEQGGGVWGGGGWGIGYRGAQARHFIVANPSSSMIFELSVGRGGSQMRLDWKGITARAIDPAVNGLVALAIALLVGLIVAIFFRSLGQRFLDRALIPFLVACDHALVTYVAPLTGVALERDWLRWGNFLTLFSVLAAIAVLAPMFYAAVAIVVGIVAVLAIYRAWEKDEREREIAEDNGVAPPQANDLGNEIVVGLLFLIVFFTLGFSRVSELEDIYRGESVVPIATTAFFVWGEILKALPIVDASEVYGLRNISGLEADGGIGRTLTFIFRVFLDLLLIATLLRLLAIIRRRASGRDLRDIRRTYASPDTGKISAAIDQLAVFALRGSLNAQNELARIALRERVIPSFRESDLLVTVAKILESVADKFGGIKYLLPAIEAYRTVLRLLNRETAPLQWASAQRQLGVALSSLAQYDHDTRRLEEAVDAHHYALNIFTRDAMPFDWAATQTSLSVALTSLGKLNWEVGYLEDSIAACRIALEVRTRESTPGEWAETQNILGNALAALGNHGADIKVLNDAADAYRAALDIYTCETAPLEWAGTQNNLAIVLSLLGEISGDDDFLDQAVSAYKAVLKVRTRNAMPSAWAATLRNLSNTLATLGENTGDSHKIEQALEGWTQVAKYYTIMNDSVNLQSIKENIETTGRILTIILEEGYRVSDRDLADRTRLEDL